MCRAANNPRIIGGLILALSGLFFSPFFLQAATLLTVSDTISTSAPSLAANHTLKFTLTTTVPPSGQIIITPQASAFSIPNELDDTDLDFLVNNANKNLAVSPGSGAGSPIGLAVTGGSSGKMIFTLNDSEGLSAGSALVIKIGANAVFAQTGDKQIINPSATGSYKVRLETKNTSGNMLDEASAMVAIVSQVAVQASKTVAPPPPAPPPLPSAPAVGGGGLPVTAPAPVPTRPRVIFKGQAYPFSQVIILSEGQIAATVTAKANADFEISPEGLLPGFYNFFIYAEDTRGRRSPLLAIPVSVKSGETVHRSGLFLAPTIEADKIAVRRGDTVAISGQSVPNGNITLFVTSNLVSGRPIIVKTQASKSGAYLHMFDTKPVPSGDYGVRANAGSDGLISPFSQVVGFKVDSRTVPKPLAVKIPAKIDLNKDAKINLIDFSILAYWYKRPLTAEAKVRVDLNGDGAVNLVDFSILMFHWTG